MLRVGVRERLQDLRVRCQLLDQAPDLIDVLANLTLGGPLPPGPEIHDYRLHTSVVVNDGTRQVLPSLIALTWLWVMPNRAARTVWDSVLVLMAATSSHVSFAL